MTEEEIVQLYEMAEHLKSLKSQGLIDDYKFLIGDSLKTTKVSLAMDDRMAPFIFNRGCSTNEIPNVH